MEEEFGPRPIAAWYMVGAIASLLLMGLFFLLFVMHVSADPASHAARPARRLMRPNSRLGDRQPSASALPGRPRGRHPASYLKRRQSRIA